MAIITVPMKVNIADDGTWLIFESNGKSASFCIETYAETRKVDGGRAHGVISSALQAWARDVRRDATEGGVT